MKLFIVTRWGSDDPPDYANGPDTNFLVSANDFEEAATLADEQLERLPHSHVSPVANVVIELGIDGGTAREARVLAGPFVQFSHVNGYQHATWIRDPQLEVTAWQSLAERMRE